MKDREIIVSVRLMTYMHEQYIKQAMDSIMMQKTNFKVEVVVGDDFSTDNTLDVVNQYKDTNNISIKILKRVKGDEYWLKRQKLGRLYNFVNILENCSGKYIALLDGDDYWTDPLKLQKQVDFLEENDEFILTAHNVMDFDEITQSMKPNKRNVQKDTVVESEDLIKGQYLQILTLCFRNVLNFNHNFFNEISNGDKYLTVHLGFKGKAMIMSDIKPGVYRKHPGGVWTKATIYKQKKQSIKFAQVMQKMLVDKPYFTSYYENLENQLHKSILSQPKILPNFINVLHHANMFFYTNGKYSNMFKMKHISKGLFKYLIK